MNLTAYLTATSEKLDDTTNTRFSINIITNALRAALADYSQLYPNQQTYQLTATGQHRITLPSNFSATNILKAEYAPNSTTYTTQNTLPFEKENINNIWTIETSQPIPAGQIITLTYTTLHTINGLDSATSTTIPIQHEQHLITAAAGYSLLIRATSRIEAINLNPDVAAKMRKQAELYLNQFHNSLNTPTFTRSTPTFHEPENF